MGNKSNQQQSDIFEYQQFLKIIQGLKNDQQDNSQQNIFCKVDDHENSKIEEICISQECQEKFIFICKECKIQNLHQATCGLIKFKQLQKVIEQFQIRICQKYMTQTYEINIQLLKITNLESRKINFDSFHELKAIETLMNSKYLSLLNIDASHFIKELQESKIGLYVLMKKLYQHVYIVQQELIEYNKQKLQKKIFQINFNSKKQSVQENYLRAQKLCIVKRLLNNQQYKQRSKDEDKLINQSIEDLYLIGLELFNFNKYKLAITYFNIQIQHNPGSKMAFQTFLKKVICLTEIQHYEEAVKALQEQIQFYKREIENSSNEKYREEMAQYIRTLLDQDQQVLRAQHIY